MGRKIDVPKRKKRGWEGFTDNMIDRGRIKRLYKRGRDRQKEGKSDGGNTRMTMRARGR